MSKAVIVKVLMYAVPIVVLLYVVTMVMKRFGIIQSGSEKREDKRNDKAANDIITSDLLNPNYHKGKLFTPLPDSMVDKFARQLGSALRWWGTNEALVYSTYKSYFNKMNISQVAEKYYEIYDEDLRAAIANDLSNEEMGVLAQIIKTLPNR